MLLVLLSLSIISVSNGQESPKVNPFAPLIKPVVGGKTSFACQALSGSLPLSFIWFKDGKEIREISSIRIRENEDLSNLIIDSISSNHSGNYTCRISNRFGWDEFSIELNIEGPPFWKEKPENIKIHMGDSVSVKCSALGFPRPKVIWQRYKESLWTPIDKHESTLESNSDELIIRKGYSNHSGQYACYISNGIEPDLRHEFSISIDGKLCYSLDT